MILIAYNDVQMSPGPAIDQLHPYKGTLSGEREHHKPSYRIGPEESKNPILMLQDDIVDKNGRGLKKGFYELGVDEEYNFFLLKQSGKLKAKIPIYEVENVKDKPPQKTKIETLTPKEYQKKLDKEKKERQKLERKYSKGEMPDKYVHSKAELFYDKTLDSWIIIREYENTRAVGGFKL